MSMPQTSINSQWSNISLSVPSPLFRSVSLSVLNNFCILQWKRRGLSPVEDTRWYIDLGLDKDGFQTSLNPLVSYHIYCYFILCLLPYIRMHSKQTKLHVYSFIELFEWLKFAFILLPLPWLQLSFFQIRAPNGPARMAKQSNSISMNGFHFQAQASDCPVK